MKVLLATNTFEERKDNIGRTTETYFLSSFTVQCPVGEPTSGVLLGGGRGINFTTENS